MPHPSLRCTKMYKCRGRQDAGSGPWMYLRRLLEQIPGVEDVFKIMLNSYTACMGFILEAEQALHAGHLTARR